MFAYCENNPVNRIDYNGQFWEELWDAFIEAVQQASGTFAVAGGVTQLDSPIPGPADLIGGAIAGVTLIGCLCIATYSAIVSSKSIISTSKENSSEQVITDTGSNPTYIYRHNGTNPGNLVPTDNDVFFSSGLSFSTVPKRNSWRTTVDAINSTGVLRAVVDGPTHVSVYPVGGTVEGWKREGTTSIWTRTLMTISIKMR